MDRRTLGRTGLAVSPIAIGGAAFTYVQKSAGWDPMSDEGRKVVHATLHSALDRGINYVDTAPAYGNGYSETLVGEVMKTRRDDCVLASKVWYELDHQGVVDSVHASLKRLQTDHIDILQVHGRMYTPAEVDHILHGGPLDALLDLREAGKIGHIGITTEEPWTVIPFLEHEAVEVYQIAYNIIYQAAARHFLDRRGESECGCGHHAHHDLRDLPTRSQLPGPGMAVSARPLRRQPQIRPVRLPDHRRHRRHAVPGRSHPERATARRVGAGHRLRGHAPPHI